jgi:hypoxanthine-guanine phosphoribosyltransferase
VNFGLLAKSFGFKNFFKPMTGKALKKVLNNLKNVKDSVFIQVKVNNEEKSERKRVSDKYTCVQIRDRFMKNVRK